MSASNPRAIAIVVLATALTSACRDDVALPGQVVSTAATPNSSPLVLKILDSFTDDWDGMLTLSCSSDSGAVTFSVDPAYAEISADGVLRRTWRSSAEPVQVLARDPLGNTGSIGIEMKPSQLLLPWSSATLDTSNVSGTAVDRHGNLLVYGITGGGPPGISNLGTGFDLYLAKYSRTRTLLWARSVGSDSWDFPNSVVVDASDNVIVSGSTYSSIDGAVNAGNRDAFVRKYDADGQPVWSRQVGDWENEWVSLAAVDTQGNVYNAVNSYLGDLGGLTHLGLFNTYLYKYSPDGTLLWVRELGLAGQQVLANGLVTNAAGELLVAGWTDGTFPTQTNSGGQDAFIAKFSSSGNLLYLSQMGTSGTDGAIPAIDGAGHEYILGTTTGAFGSYTRLGATDGFVAPVNGVTGAVGTVVQLGVPITASSPIFAMGPSGSIYLIGTVAVSFDGYDPVAGGSDLFLAKYALDGSRAWVKQFGLPYAESNSSLYIDPDEMVYAGGNLSGGDLLLQSSIVRKFDVQGSAQ